jgi:hypothetical protein
LAFLPQLLIIHGDFLLVCRRQVGHFRFGGTTRSQSTGRGSLGLCSEVCCPGILDSFPRAFQSTGLPFAL